MIINPPILPENLCYELKTIFRGRIQVKCGNGLNLKNSMILE
jgi:hypothetical protein